MVRMVAYQNLYGPAGPDRFDLLFARLGMDVAAPHMKRGRRPKLKDHLLQWSRKAKPRKTPDQMIDVFVGMRQEAERAEKAEQKRREKREKKQRERQQRAGGKGGGYGGDA